MSTMYSIILNFYPDSKTSALTWIEAGMCVGIMCGPVLGAVLYSIDGYEFMCFAFGGMLITSALGI
jgi:MFS family permease